MITIKKQKYFYAFFLLPLIGLFVISNANAQDAPQPESSQKFYSFTAASGSDITASFQKTIGDARSAGGGGTV